LWVADISYIPTWAGLLYLAVVLDAVSRKIVGWAMANHLRTELVLAALDMALLQRPPAQVIHHSGQSGQYTSLAFVMRWRAAGVRPSRGSVGDCYDNALCESLFATLECALLERRSFRTQSEARMAVFDFTEGCYNPHRRHSALDYRSPCEYQRHQRAAPHPTARSSTALRTAWPPKDALASAVQGIALSDPKSTGFSSPASNRAKAGAEKLLTDQRKEVTVSDPKPSSSPSTETGQVHAPPSRLGISRLSTGLG
jgi:putative transposase